MIELGLARISRLLQHTPQAWKPIHVAGTNGKGSICAYLSALLHANRLTCGRFTSPHLVDRWDCVSVNERPVSETEFHQVETLVQQRNRNMQLKATEFELLTATAFELFHRQKVKYGVVEVGVGGRLDATNALKQKAVTVIAKVGLDHQSLLGNTLEEIALQKAGIMRNGVPCVVDGSNDPGVLHAIREHARKVGAEVHFPSTSDVAKTVSEAGLGLQPHQIQNLACAHLAFRLACPDRDASLSHLAPVIKAVQWPGRLQMLNVSKIFGRQAPILLDGAHNTQSAEVLADFVQKTLRPRGRAVTWILAFSQGKDLDGMLKLLLQPGDKVSAVRFGPVDGMPWVTAADPSLVLSAITRLSVDISQQLDTSLGLQDTLKWAIAAAAEGPLVVAGSLYLVSDVLRLVRESAL